MPTRSLVPTLGLAAFALAIGVAYICGGFVPRHGLLLAPAAFLGAVAAFWIGLSGSRAVVPLGRLRSAALHTSLFCVLLILPAGIRWVWLQRELSTIPVPPDAASIHREVNLICFTPHTPPYSIRYTTRLSFDQADEFLRQGFIANGWEVGWRSREHETFANSRFEIRSGDIALRRAWSGGRFRRYAIIRAEPDRYLDVELVDIGGECLIDCKPKVDPLSESLRGFWR